MNRKLIFFISSLIFLFVSCEYEPTDIYERNINNNVTPSDIEVVSLDLSMEKDTIDLLYNRVYFHFESSEQEIKRVKFYINDTVIGTVESNNGFFDINYYFTDKAYQKLKLEIFTNSGTGSIADVLGVEQFVFTSKEWVIKVHDSNYSTVTTIVEDGFLKLRWPQPYQDISEFIIYRSNYEIGRTSRNEFIDKGYVGEGGKYYVRYIDNISGKLKNYGWVDIPNEIEIRFTADKYNNYYIEWNKPKYYSAIDSAILFNYGDYAPYRESISDFNSQKHLIPKKFFGTKKTYWLMFTPKQYNPIYEQYTNPNTIYTFPHSERIECVIGCPSPIFDYFDQISSSECIYHTNKYDHSSTSYNDSVFRYSSVENKNLKSYRYNPPGYSIYWRGDHYNNLTTSPNGKYFTAKIGFTNTIMFCSTTDFSDYQILENDNLIGSNSSYKTPISNVGTGIIYSFGKKALYDFENDILLDEIESSTSFSDFNISFDGKFLFLRLSHTICLYSVKEGKIIFEEGISNMNPSDYDYFNFYESEANTVVTWGKESKTFSVRTCPDMEIIYSFQLTEEGILDIDYSTNRILSYSSNLLIVRSLENGAILYEIPAIVSAYYWKDFKLIGNSIFYEDGVRYFLN